MNLQEIKIKVKEIEEIQYIPAAHQMEDELYTDFIKYVAAGGSIDLKEKAETILETKKMDFPRWYE